MNFVVNLIKLSFEMLSIYFVDKLPYFISLLFVTVVAHFAVFYIVDNGWKCIGLKRGTGDYLWQAAFVGCFERILYVVSLQLDRAEFIGIWLILKTAAKWRRWGADRNEKGDVISGRAIYNIFLLGNGLSLIYAVTGYKIIEWLKFNLYFHATFVSINLFLITLVAGKYIARCHIKRDKHRRKNIK